MRLHATAHTLHDEFDGFQILLDINSSAYYILDPVGTSMWKALLDSADEAEALETLLSQYSVERGRLKADLDAFKNRCLENGFLQENEPQPSTDVPLRVKPRGPYLLRLRAWWCLFRTVWSLSRNRFRSTYRECSRLAVPEEPADGSEARLQRAVAAFAWAENFFLIKRAPKDCMPRSLALFRFLRSAGLPVEHCIGVRRFPLEAHAWVEYRGRVLHDNPARRQSFKTLARIPA